MPQKKVILNRIRSLGEVIDDSILFLKQNWKPLLKAYFTICGLFWLAGLAVSTIDQFNSFQMIADGASQIEATYTWTYLASMIIELVTHALIMLTCLSFMVLYRDKGNIAPGVDEVWSYVKFYFFRVIGSYILLSIVLFIGLIFCVVPGIYFMPVMSLILTIMIIENGTLRYSFNRSFRLIQDKWWHTFGAFILSLLLIAVAILLIIIPAMLIATAIVFVTGKYGSNVYMVAFNIAIHLGQFLYLLPYITIALVYFSLTEQKEDHTLLERIEMLGKNEPEPNQPTAEEEY